MAALTPRRLVKKRALATKWREIYGALLPSQLQKLKAFKIPALFLPWLGLPWDTARQAIR